MRKDRRYLLLALVLCILHLPSIAQNSVTITGNVRNNFDKSVVPAVSVTIKGSTVGTFTDDKGNFRITTTQKPPLTLVITSVGFESQEVTVNNASDVVQVDFVPASTLGTEVVVSASRVPERILVSPVTVERVSAATIRNSPVPSYYDIVTNMKGVDMVTSSLTFKTPTTRGFGLSGNLRFNQLVDGMDNQAPGLNFSVGGVIGLTELDVDNIELLPGASSALYGPGGMNGTLLINSKSPFKYQGLSFQIKQGILHTDKRSRNSQSPYYNWSLRWAKKIGERFAFKITTELVQARDWVGIDNRNYKRTGTDGALIPGNRQTDPNYDGVNVYGDETSGDIRGAFQGIVGQAPFLAPYAAPYLASPFLVSRTGYDERDIIDPTTLNYKLGGALHYKISNSVEAVLEGFWGTGNTVYTGSDRYSLKNLKIGQYKLELNGGKWFIRGYTTQENAGESFNATVTTRLLNEAWKPSIGPATNPTAGWFFQYAQAFLVGKLNGLNDYEANQTARSTADVGRPAAGSAQFKQLFNQIRSVPISKGGGLFLDKTDLYNVEGQYNLSSITNGFMDILAGGNYKRYVLNSEGTLFADSAGKIGINEFGAYLQLSKSMFNDVVKLTVSGRYDKNQNFKGRLTPRATAVFKLNENNHLRLSFQTAYRFPSTQQQWIDLSVGAGSQLIGGVPELKNYYQFNTRPLYIVGKNGSISSTPTSFDEFKPESVSSYEVGYKGLVASKKLLIDLYGYYGKYKDFIVRNNYVQSTTAAPPTTLTGNLLFSVPTNSTNKVTTYGAGLSLDYSLPKSFLIGFNASTDRLEDVPGGFIANFNAPKYRVNLSFSNTGFGKDRRVGFNVAYRWQDSFFYESDFANGNVPSVQTLDAQLSYKYPKSKSIVKLGASNLLNQYYVNGVGNPSIGGLYYISFGYNIY